MHQHENSWWFTSSLWDFPLKSANDGEINDWGSWCREPSCWWLLMQRILVKKYQLPIDHLEALTEQVTPWLNRWSPWQLIIKGILVSQPDSYVSIATSQGEFFLDEVLTLKFSDTSVTLVIMRKLCLCTCTCIAPYKPNYHQYFNRVATNSELYWDDGTPIVRLMVTRSEELCDVRYFQSAPALQCS